MQTKLARPLPLTLRKLDLSEHLTITPPRPPQPLENRPILQPTRRSPHILTRHINQLSAHRRPHTKVEPRLGAGHGRVQQTVGMPRPGSTLTRSFLPREHTHLTEARSIRLLHLDLKMHPTLLGHDQRRFQGQFLNPATADLIARQYRQLHERCPGQQRHPMDGVIRQPLMRGQRQPTTQQHPATTGQRHHRTQQRMPQRTQPHRTHITHTRRGIKPETLPLEGIRRQVDLPATVSGEHLPPVDACPADIKLSRRGQEPLGPTLVTAQRADDHSLGVSGLHRLLDRQGQHRMRAHLDEHGVALIEQKARRGLQLHRLTQVAVPVLRVQPGRIHQLTRHRRVERHLRRARLQARQDLQQLPTDRLHMRRVRGVVHRNPTNPHLLTLKFRDQLIQRTRITGDHNRARPVDRGDRDSAIPTGDALPRLVHRQPHRHHATTARQTTRDGPRPQRHHLRGILQRQRARHTRRRDLTLTVTHHRIRHHPHRTPQPRQRHHHREQHRLHHIHPIKTGSTLGTTQHIRQRPVHIRRQSRLTLGHRLREHRRGVQQPHRHPHPLRPLTREHEHRTPRCLGAIPPDHTRELRPLSYRLQALDELLAAGSGHHDALLEREPGRRQGERHVSGAQLGALGHELPQSACLRAQRGVGLARHHPGHRTRDTAVGRFLGSLGLGRLNLRRLLQDHVRVRPAHTERGHTGPARLARLRPRPGFGQQLDLTLGPVHVARRLVHVQRLRQDAVPHRHHHLDDTGHTGSGLGVTEVRLQRTQPQRTALRPVLAVGGQQRLRLDRVTQRRAGAVRLDRVDLTGGQFAVLEGLPDHAALRGAVGGRQAVARAVLVHGGAAHHRQDLVPVAPRVGQPLHQQHTDALGPGGAVGGVSERLAPAVGGQSALAAEGDEALGAHHDRRTADQRHGTLALTQRLRGQVQGDQRR